MESTKSADEINAAVMRIGRVSKAVFEDKRLAPPERQMFREQGDAKPNPGPDHKSFAPNDNSVSQRIPSHEMPSKDAKEKQPGVDDYDDEEEVIAKPEQGAKKEHKERKIMNKVVSETGVRNMAEWRTLAGLSPMYEENQTGDVPTSGASKQNKMKSGGLPGLEGQAVQDIEPEETFDDGADAEETLDPAPGDLKKESYSRYFGHFLEERGLTVELFSQLVDEAMESNDVEEMNALLAVEGIFGDWMKKKRSGSDEGEKNKAMLAKTAAAIKAKKAGKIDPTYGRPKMSLRRVKAGVSQETEDQEEEFTFEADSDENGNPDWKRAFAQMRNR